jgi:hypothetical protein
MQIRVELWMTRLSWETGLPVFEDKNGIGSESADDDSLEMCAEMVVGHAVGSAVLWHRLEADMSEVLSRRQRILCLGSHISLRASVHLFEALGWEVEGETRLDVVCVAVSMPFLNTAERSG